MVIDKTIIQRGQVFLILMLIFFAIVNSYNGNYHGFYLNLYQLFFDQFDFINDIYLTNTLAYKSSFLYDILKITHINLDNDLSGFFLTFIFSLCSAFIVYRIGVNYLYLEKIDALIIILMLCKGYFILAEALSAIFFTHTGTPSQYCHYLMFFLVYYTLRKKVMMSSIIATLMVGLTFKVAWLPICTSVIACAYNSETRKKTLWYIIPGILLLYMASKTIWDGDHLTIYKFILDRDGSEDAPSLQSLGINIFFVTSFLFSYFLTELLDNEAFKVYLKILIIFSSVIYIFSWIYTSLLADAYPLPSLLLLSPVRSMALYSFFAKFIIFSTIIKKINTNSKYLVLLLAHILISLFVISRYQSDNLFLLMGIGFIILFLALTLLYLSCQKKMSYFSQHISLIILVLFFSSQTFMHTYKTATKFNSLAFKKLKKWTIEKMDAEIFNDLYALRSCPDFTFLYLGNQYGNFISGKSSFIGDSAHFYLNVPLQEIAKNRQKVIKDLKEKLTKNAFLSSYDTNFLKKSQVVILHPIHQNSIFQYGSGLTVEVSKNYAVSTYGIDDPSISNCLKSIKTLG